MKIGGFGEDGKQKRNSLYGYLEENKLTDAFFSFDTNMSTEGS